MSNLIILSGHQGQDEKMLSCLVYLIMVGKTIRFINGKYVSSNKNPINYVSIVNVKLLFYLYVHSSKIFLVKYILRMIYFTNE